MAGIDIAYSSLEEMELALIAAAESVQRDPTPQNLLYFRKVFEAWQRKDWVIARTLNLLANTPLNLTVETTDNWSTGALADNGQDTPFADIISETDPVLILGIYYAVSCPGGAFNTTSDQGIRFDLSGTNILWEHMDRTSPLLTGTGSGILIQQVPIPPQTLLTAQKLTLLITSYAGVAIQVDGRFFYAVLQT